MAYFTDYPRLSYPFAENATPTEFVDLGAYVDMLDRVKDDISFYKTYYIRNGDRPDQVSYTLYDTADYYWTFYNLNDDLKRRGWPLTNTELDEKAKREYPHTTLTTRADLSNQFLVGSTVTGTTSGATGTILRRRPDFGQIIVDQTSTADFQAAETITTVENDTSKSIVIDAQSEEYNSKHHYEDANGNYVDISPRAPFIQRVSYEVRWNGSDTSDPDNFIIDKIKISNQTSIYTEFSLNEVTTQAVLGNILPGGSALIIGGALQLQFATDTEYTIGDLQTNFFGGVLGMTGVGLTAVGTQLAAIVNSIQASGGTPPTTIVYHTFTLVDNQLNLYGADQSVPQYLAFEFRSNVDVNMTTVLGGVYEPLPFDTITANDTLNANERNFVVYKNIGFTGSAIPESPFLTDKTTDTVSTANSAFNYVQNEFETYIASNYNALVPATITPVTFLERYQKENEELREIKVLKPDIIDEFERQVRKTLIENPNAEVEFRSGNVSGNSTFKANPSVPTASASNTVASRSGGSSY
jgi:hypothetical protein